MFKYMLDTNIVIYTMKNKPTAVREQFNKHYNRMCISSVTYMELVYGAERSANSERNLRELEGFVARMDVLPYESGAAEHTGQLRAELANQGKPIGSFDVMIAGHARSLGLIVVTNNTKEFDRVAGLRVENWV